MNIDKSKILIKALLYKESFIPIWELTGNDTEDYGFQYKVKGDWNTYSESSLLDVYYDINTKEITSGEIVEYKDVEELPKIGDFIFYERLHSVIKRAKLLDIKWVVNNNYIGMGEYMERNYKYYFKDTKLDYNKLYHVKVYEPRYVIEGEEREVWPYAIKQVEL